jgi:hypothetical protein
MIQPKILISQADIEKVVASIYRTIIQGMDLAANVIATEVQLAARRYLVEGIAAYGAPKKPGRGTGGLSQGIMVKEFKSGGAEYSRYDVYIDTKLFPYALWVEWGRNAGSAKPYANKGGKDYSKSKFSGHLFLTKALEEFSSEKSRDIARECILGSLFTKKRI